MSYGSDICPNCGGEVRVAEGYGGTCPNCGHWVSAGTVDSLQAQLDREKKEEEIRRERMKHVIKIVVTCYDHDEDNSWSWTKEFTNMEDAEKWERSHGGGYSEYEYYDENGRIE